MSSAPSVGRPRSGARRLPTGTARDEILDAAAELFAERGYAATSTRMIAEMVGVRQASLYYHFKTKEQILAELLESTVRPSLEYAAELSGQGLGPAEALHALVVYDVGVLLGARWNVGILYALPEIATEPFARFRAEREQLRLAYRRLVAADRPGTSEVTGDLVFGLVESVIGMRRDLPSLPPRAELQSSVAAAALRLAGLG
ncbi:AcrR family transcriptional regulator [Actinoplanes campanulatus]|uniref:AcrR family transcriptional regulator n=1 Tax=Actinoplanes campanulatus TaxID=113559 RepID=A0A7W5FK14_9ACTN|nr:TetR/AcrR family transcriptional regulator [Actinoplanes campanulatus]MBB3101216.1 AcrR family transcriptional regulator [Actinoplanes campanulatus]GGN51968.1 TetR family transcriptional regulator [Actinoplanes campanulatus]GID41963.1 TetR family transcriptional regulator [Actinoplanes campanulatus]